METIQRLEAELKGQIEKSAYWHEKAENATRECDALIWYLAEMFGSPCDFCPTDEYMGEFRECVEDCTDNNEVCWRRVMRMATIKKAMKELESHGS